MAALDWLIHDGHDPLADAMACQITHGRQFVWMMKARRLPH
jgi:hypothetical protein